MATHGEIQWPPVGRINGRLRGESHGRRQDWFESWWDEASKTAGEHGVDLLATRFHQSTSMDVALYDALIEIRCPLH